MLVLALTAVATAGAVAAWIADRRRSTARNATGHCGSCGVPWSDSGAPYLIHGRMVCEECAHKARRRMPWELAALASWAALVAGISLGNVFAGNFAAVAVIIVAPTIMVPLGAVRLMKRANLRAQRKIAAGDFPGLSSGNGTPGASPAGLAAGLVAVATDEDPAREAGASGPLLEDRTR